MRKVRYLVPLVIGVLVIVPVALVGLALAFFYLVPPMEITNSDVVGSYVGYYDVFPKITSADRKNIFKGGTHRMQVKADGTYVYLYEPVNGNSVKTAGTWTLEAWEDGRTSIVFKDLTLAPIDSNAVRPSYHAMPIRQGLDGSIRIVISDDLGYYWIRERR